MYYQHIRVHMYHPNLFVFFKRSSIFLYVLRWVGGCLPWRVRGVMIYVRRSAVFSELSLDSTDNLSWSIFPLTLMLGNFDRIFSQFWPYLFQNFIWFLYRGRWCTSYQSSGVLKHENASCSIYSESKETQSNYIAQWISSDVRYFLYIMQEANAVGNHS